MGHAIILSWMPFEIYYYDRLLLTTLAMQFWL